MKDLSNIYAIQSSLAMHGGHFLCSTQGLAKSLEKSVWKSVLIELTLLGHEQISLGTAKVLNDFQ